MKNTCLILCLLAIAACSKNSEKKDVLSGVWVEKSQRLDTISFDLSQETWGWGASEKVFELRAKPFVETAGGSDTIRISGLYIYKQTTDSVALRSIYSSSLLYHSFAFTIQTTESFAIERFYKRDNLPSTLEFVRIY